jgi:aminoglycoside phosphotransferase (APT) family kinase protein
VSVLQRDAEETAATLASWLADVAGVARPVVTDVSMPAATGWSNETIMFDATWGVDDDRCRRRLVARVAPSGYRVFPDDTFLRQHAVMHALAEHTDVPMPRLHWIDADASWFGQPFWIMDRVVGDVPADVPPYSVSGWIHELDPDDQQRLWWAGVEAMARVHRVDPDRIGLADDILPRDGTLDRHLDHYERYLRWGEEGRPFPLARDALAVLRRDRPSEPAEGRALVWGDARLSNLVYRDLAVVAVLDWEMCGIGDPLLDVGYWLFADGALTAGSGAAGRLPGFATRDETAARWSIATGRSVDALPYYELFGAFRFTVIMLRMGKLLAGIGLVDEDFARDNLISRGLAEELARF